MVDYSLHNIFYKKYYIDKLIDISISYILHEETEFPTTGVRYSLIGALSLFYVAFPLSEKITLTKLTKSTVGL